MQAEVNLVWQGPHPRSASANGTRPLRFVSVVWLRQTKCEAKADTLWVVKRGKSRLCNCCRDCTEMKGCSAKIFCITVLYVAGEERLLKYPFLIQCLLGINNVSGQSTLQPAMVHSCPNETVIFTCFGRQAMNMELIMEPYVLEEDAKSFVATLAVNNRNTFTFTYTDLISSKLTNLTGYENKTADMTVTLTIEMNGANITCKVDDLFIFATLFVAGMWSMWSNNNNSNGSHSH